MFINEENNTHAAITEIGIKAMYFPPNKPITI